MRFFNLDSWVKRFISRFQKVDQIFAFPESLTNQLDMKVPKLDGAPAHRLRAMLPLETLSGGFLPRLFQRNEIEQANMLWRSPHKELYRGKVVANVYPGFIDYSKTLIFGEIEPDSPLALDYRDRVPQVIYFGHNAEECCFWQSLHLSHEEFLNRLFSEGSKVSGTSTTVR